MLHVKKTTQDKTAILSPAGRLDTLTAPEMDEAIREATATSDDLILDFTELEYVSSAGLRVLLTAQKTMNARGKMRIRNVNETISEIFEVTGFSDILTIE